MSVLCEGNKLGTLVQPECHHQVIAYLPQKCHAASTIYAAL